MKAPSGIYKCQQHVYRTAASKGWHEGPVNVWEKIALIHSELSEAVEEMREPGYNPTRIYLSEDGKPEGLPIELADAVIRIMDLCEALNIDLEEAIQMKDSFNQTRPHRHGGKLA
jgi:NTP pyrophosphatase (non-canonical NTP hydrolase)